MGLQLGGGSRARCSISAGIPVRGGGKEPVVAPETWGIGAGQWAPGFLGREGSSEGLVQ